MIGYRPKLYASEGKHATYISADECGEAISSWEWWSWDEDCGEGKVITPVTSINYNVGEYYPGKSMTLEDFGIASHFEFSAHSAGIGYLSEHVWTTHINTWNRETYFCGGALVKNFTERHQVIDPGYDEVNCPGGLHYKWWIPPEFVGSCYEENTDRFGSDYYSFEMTNPDAMVCMQACKDDSNCISYTYVKPGYQGVNAICYLKNEAPEKTANDCCDSGLRNACMEGY